MLLIVCNRQKLETTSNVHWQMNYKQVINSFNGQLLSNKKESSTDSYNGWILN